MLNRRDFLRTVGSTTTGAFIMTRLGDALAQASRREVFVGGQRATTVDIHAHCVFPEVSDLLTGTRFSDVGFAPWQALGPERLDSMNQLGIDYQALSINRYWWYGADRTLAADVV